MKIHQYKSSIQQQLTHRAQFEGIYSKHTLGIDILIIEVTRALIQYKDIFLPV